MRVESRRESVCEAYHDVWRLRLRMRTRLWMRLVGGK